MTDEEARHGLGLDGPVVGAGGLGWCWRTLQSPYFPGGDIQLYERLGHDGSLHVTEWNVEPSRK